MRGSDTEPIWEEIAALLASCVSDVEECTIQGAGHLLHMQRPRAVAESLAGFFGRNPLTVLETPRQIARAIAAQQ